MINVAAQRALSNSIATIISRIVRDNYHTTGEAIDIGSYGRGTNTNTHPDIDLFFTGIPHDPQQGFVDWTAVDTFKLISSWDGIQDLTNIQQFDPILFETITQSLEQLKILSPSVQFCGVKAWKDDPGVVFMLSLDYPPHGTFKLDTTLHYANSHFSTEHVKRFERYRQRIIKQHGEEHMQQVLADIRHLKQAIRTESTPDGKVDRRKKVSGFVIEALFLYQVDPLTYDEVISLLHNYTMPIDEEKKLPEYIQDQQEPLIDANKTLDDVLHSVTRGGYKTLKTVAARENKKQA